MDWILPHARTVVSLDDSWLPVPGPAPKWRELWSGDAIEVRHHALPPEGPGANAALYALYRGIARDLDVEAGIGPVAGRAGWWWKGPPQGPVVASFRDDPDLWSFVLSGDSRLASADAAIRGARLWDQDLVALPSRSIPDQGLSIGVPERWAGKVEPGAYELSDHAGAKISIQSRRKPGVGWGWLVEAAQKRIRIDTAFRENFSAQPIQAVAAGGNYGVVLASRWDDKGVATEQVQTVWLRPEAESFCVVSVSAPAPAARSVLAGIAFSVRFLLTARR
jgi:hypothetical protein